MASVLVPIPAHQGPMSSRPFLQLTEMIRVNRPGTWPGTAPLWPALCGAVQPLPCCVVSGRTSTLHVVPALLASVHFEK